MRTTNLLGAVALVGVVLWAGTSAQAQSRAAQTLYLKSHERFLELFQPAVQDAANSTVRLISDGDEVALGTIVSADGWVITKASQIEGDRTPEIRLPDGKTIRAEVIGSDEDYDIALLKIERTDLTPIKFTESKEGLVGNWVATPDLEGRAIAVGVIGVGTRNISSFELRIAKATRVGGAFLGIQMRTIDGEGVQVEEVIEKSGAEKAGLKKGDLIVGLGEKVIRDQNILAEMLRTRKPGDTIELKIVRSEKERTIEATLGKRPSGDSRSDYQNNLGSKLSDHRAGYPTILQHDTVIPPTDCGGPLVDLDGRVLGVNIARAGRTESYAIPGEIITRIVDKLKPTASVSGNGEGD